MTIIEIILIGIALSMDAFSVSLSSGMVYSGMTKRQRLLLPIAFGIFQGIMPVAGYFLGYAFKNIIEKWQGPVSLAILGVIGINMIYEGIKRVRNGEEQSEKKQLTIPAVAALAIATSIDAFAVGVSFAASGMRIDFNVLSQNIFVSSAIIAIITFVLCVAAIVLGNKAASRFGSKAGIFGGIVLIIIGIKNMFF